MAALWAVEPLDDAHTGAGNRAERRSLDATQKLAVRFPCATAGKEVALGIDHGRTKWLVGEGAFQHGVETGDLLGFKALQVEPAVSIELEDGEAPVSYAQHYPVGEFDGDANHSHPLTSELGQSATSVMSKHAREGVVCQTMQCIVLPE